MIRSLLMISISTSLFMLVFILIKKLLRKYVKPSMVMFVWSLFIIRLMIPIMFETTQKVWPIKEVYLNEVLLPLQMNMNLDYGHVNIFSFDELLTMIYIAGLVVSLSHLIIVLLVQHRRNKHLNLPDKELLESCRELGYNGRVLVSHDHSPYVAGFRPTLVLPKNICDEDLKWVIKHESIHIKNRDIFRILLLELVACIHWFNPIIRYLKKVILDDMEIACDEAVIENLDFTEQGHYSKTLCELATHQRFLLTTPFIRMHTLKRRLMQIRDRKYIRSAGILFVTMAMTVISISIFHVDAFGLPKYFNAFEQGWVNTAKDQGDTGAGAVFSTNSALETRVAIEKDQLIILSEQKVLSHVHVNENRGISPEKILNYYEEQEDIYQIDEWKHIVMEEFDKSDRVDEIKKLIDDYGSVLSVVSVYEDLMNHKHGVYHYDGLSKAIGGRWLTIIGWSDTEACWIVKTSWGNDWGDKGFGKIGYHDLCGINDFIIYYIKEVK